MGSQPQMLGWRGDAVDQRPVALMGPELGPSPVHQQKCYAYGLLLTCTRNTYGLTTILAVYETAQAYPGITPYVYFSIYFILCSPFKGSRLVYSTGDISG